MENLKYVTQSIFTCFFLVFLFVGATQCGKRFNTTKFEDKNAGSEWVYGIDSTKLNK